jgi:hypothetical protein
MSYFILRNDGYHFDVLPATPENREAWSLILADIHPTKRDALAGHLADLLRERELINRALKRTRKMLRNKP